MTVTRTLTALFTIGAAVALTAQTPQPPPAQPPVSQQPDAIAATITGAPGLPPKIAVPDFIPLSSDPDTVAAAKALGPVLWDDLNFEREFYLIPRDTYRSIPQPASPDQVALDRWKELGADGVVVGSIRKGPSGYVVKIRQKDPSIGFNLEMITREPLKIPIFTEKYWVTFDDSYSPFPARDLAKTVKFVNRNPPKKPMPATAGMSPAEQLKQEDDNNRLSVEWARTNLAM
jgi:hypothetical protein